MSVVILLALSMSAITAYGQTDKIRGKNNPYSPSPVLKAKQAETSIKTTSGKSGPDDVAFVMQKSSGTVRDDSPPMLNIRPTIAQTTFNIAKTADLRKMPLTEIYKIGIGDILFINLKNSSNGSGYYTVRPDGTIDYPLAGDNVIVAERTVDSVKDTLASSITLFPNPQVEVKIREYASHKITVSGLVDIAGEKSLQREAMPLYAIRAAAVVSPKATNVLITRGHLQPVETYDLRDGNTDNILVYPGNTIAFTGVTGSSQANGRYFISGEIVTAGQKDMTTGLTLYQAVTASGGVKGDPKKAIVRRKNDKGMLTKTEFNLRSIKEGKTLDPQLTSGDVIEIRK